MNKDQEAEFQEWWRLVGSGITPQPCEDREDFSRRVAYRAFCACYDLGEPLNEIKAAAVEEVIEKMQLSNSLYSGFHHEGTKKDSYILGLQTQLAVADRHAKQLRGGE